MLAILVLADFDMEEEQEMIVQPCIPSEYSGSFKEYVLQNDGVKKTTALKKGMDTKSCILVDRILDIVQSFPDCQSVMSRVESPSQTVLDNYITEKEILSYIEYVDQMDTYQETYRLSSPVVAQDVFYFHHGLRNAPKAVLQYIRGKTFIDAGSYNGDSAVILLGHYNPRRVLSFDISPINYHLYSVTMLQNEQIEHDSFQLYQIGLSDTEETRWIRLETPELSDRQTAQGADPRVEQQGNIVPVLFQTMDSFLKRFYPKESIGFIKTDLEGAGLEALRGMKTTIRQHRPVLSLAVYHNPQEFFETKPELERILNGIKYKYYLLRLYGGIDYFGEIVLFAYPAELGVYE